mmetsp:Transcript_64827/g.198252  ORF Transcript_64827/g.198252 Transcript_64827/m.198252 type:complete len:148 (-) Transcript_64827:2363-2806(-)
MAPLLFSWSGGWRHTGMRSNSSWVPCSTTRPSSNTTILSQALIVVRRCAMTRAVAWVASTRASKARWTTFSLAGSSAEVASSRIRNCGSRTIARAMAMRWRWPPESVRPRLPTKVYILSGRAWTKSKADALRKASHTCASVGSGCTP